MEEHYQQLNQIRPVVLFGAKAAILGPIATHRGKLQNHSYSKTQYQFETVIANLKKSYTKTNISLQNNFGLPRTQCSNFVLFHAHSSNIAGLINGKCGRLTFSNKSSELMLTLLLTQGLLTYLCHLQETLRNVRMTHEKLVS